MTSTGKNLGCRNLNYKVEQIRGFGPPPKSRALHDSHTGANMAELLNNVAEEWGITEKGPALVTDNASNMIVAAELTGILHVKCYAHTLNLATQRALKLPAVARLLG